MLFFYLVIVVEFLVLRPIKRNRKAINIYLAILTIAFVVTSCSDKTPRGTIVLRDIIWDNSSPASMAELTIPSDTSVLQAFIYKANGRQKHPTLILLHGYPGNEKNLDLAQVVRSRGWNVIYFNYRGSWGNQGLFSFTNCVEDVVNVVDYCQKSSDLLQIDTSNIVLFGHSLGAWVCLKALQKLPNVKKGIALSTWDIYNDFKNVKDIEQMLMLAKKRAGEYRVLNTPLREIFEPVLKNLNYYNLTTSLNALSGKQIIMIDEHHRNQQLAYVLRNTNQVYFDYEVWRTDHAFTNKRVSLINTVITFLDK